MRSDTVRAVAALSVAVLLAFACGPAPADDRPSLVVITMDTTRADHLGCYGYFRDTSPNIDELARESVLFENCLTPVPQTLPTHTTLFTGLYPYEHGILANVSQSRSFVPSPKVKLLAQSMREAGYDTAAFVAAEPVKRAGGLAPGFDTWWEPDKRKVGANVVIDNVIAFLSERDDSRPLFLWVHVFDAHAKYEPPPPYDTMFSADERQAAHLAELDVFPGWKHPEKAGVEVVAVEEHNLYDGEIRHADEHLGRLFGELKRLGTWEELVLVLTGDHGEGLLQHAKLFHAELWLEQLRVPLLFKAPGLAPDRRADFVGSSDVLLSAIGLVPGLEVADWRAQSTGRDLFGPKLTPEPVFGQYAANRKVIAHSIIIDGWRLITGFGDDRLFDLTRDPFELQNLAEKHPDKVATFAEQLEQARERQRALGASRDVGHVVDADPERVSALRELGYGGDEDGGDDDDGDDDGED